MDTRSVTDVDLNRSMIGEASEVHKDKGPGSDGIDLQGEPIVRK